MWRLGLEKAPDSYQLSYYPLSPGHKELKGRHACFKQRQLLCDSCRLRNAWGEWSPCFGVSACCLWLSDRLPWARRQISLHAVWLWKLHTPSPQVMQLDHIPRELPRLSNLGRIFEVNVKKQVNRWAILKSGDDIYAVIEGLRACQHIHIEPSFWNLEKTRCE